MKRVVLVFSVFVFLSSGIFAQSLALKHGDDVVSNDTVYMMGEITDELLELHIKVQNLTDKEIEVKVKKREISLVKESVNTFCWGGSCFMPTVKVSPVSTKISANDTDFNSFAGDYYPEGMEGSSIISYTFFNVQNEEDSVMVTAFYQVGATGIENLKFQKNQLRIYPNPIVDQVNIEFSALPEYPYSVRLVSLNGQLLREWKNNAKEVTHSFFLGEISSSLAIMEITDNKGLFVRRKVLVGN